MRVIPEAQRHRLMSVAVNQCWRRFFKWFAIVDLSPLAYSVPGGESYAPGLKSRRRAGVDMKYVEELRREG